MSAPPSAPPSQLPPPPSPAVPSSSSDSSLPPPSPPAPLALAPPNAAISPLEVGIIPPPTLFLPSFSVPLILAHSITVIMDYSWSAELSRERTTEKSEADKIVDGMDFGELCDEFECISSPLVESTARQLARDILELREGSRALGTFAVSVKYKDPLRTFTGRDKYKRPLWLTGALENPSVSVQEMVMLSTSVLSIKWTVKGKPKWVLSAISGDVVIRITSRFTLNQISGQVIEHQEDWDLSSSSSIAQAFFWTSRGFFAATESGKDFTQFIKTFPSRLPSEKENMEIYPDPAGDPMKFFQRDDSFQQDLYQVALLLAVLYFVVQWLRTTL